MPTFSLRKERTRLIERLISSTCSNSKISGGISNLVNMDEPLQALDGISTEAAPAPSQKQPGSAHGERSRLPVFRLGSVLRERKSVLPKWISGQEAEGRALWGR